jgi:hypothetical protein
MTQCTIEAVITAPIINPESRIHQRLWRALRQPALLSRPAVPKKTHADPVVVDISWFLERMLEIISIPDSVVISQEDSQCIVSLDKRRSVHLL